MLPAQVAEGEGEGLEGMQSALGTYDIDAEKTYRQNVYFNAIRIAPAPGAGPEALQKWRAVFGAGNPGMVGRPSAPCSLLLASCQGMLLPTTCAGC